MRYFITLVAVIICIPNPANAQTYNWTIENSESIYGQDQDTPNTKRSSTTHLNITIKDKSPNQIEATINTLDMTIPNTPIGDISLDSNDPKDESNPLEAVLRPLVGFTFTLTYDPKDHQVTPSNNLNKLRGTSALGQSFSRPYITPVFAPFMIFQGEASIDSPRSSK